MSTETEKKPFRQKALETGRVIEASAVELSRKFWLAGIGAYGMAYDVARSGATTVNEQSAEVFEDLVKRGGELETEVLTSINTNSTVTAASEQVQKVVDRSQKLQDKVRDRFETRMKRMRSLLKFGDAGASTESLIDRLDQLEKDIEAATGDKVGGSKTLLKRRLASLTEAIDDYVGKAETAAPEVVVEAEAKPEPAPAPKAIEAPEAEPEAEPAPGAELTEINGIGPAMAKKLADAGIASVSDLAAVSEEQAVELDKTIGSRGRLVRDAWVEQAKRLAA